jgi:hypothetical protein
MGLFSSLSPGMRVPLGGGQEKGRERKGKGGSSFLLGSRQSFSCSLALNLFQSPKHRYPINETFGGPIVLHTLQLMEKSYGRSAPLVGG